MNNQYESFQHTFLIAMPQMDDPICTKAVVYLYEFNAQGAMGIMINKPIEHLKLGDLLQQFSIDAEDEVDNALIYRGGPLAVDQGFIIRRRHRRKTANHPLTQLEITISSSRKDLIEIAQKDKLKDVRVALGYLGWGPGQLDQELMENLWLTAPFSEATLFEDTPQPESTDKATDMWYAAAATLGIDLNRLSFEIGHA
ncbi:MAG: YqgE/AlgH family protein [Gammaproteobacteria bacterium]